MKEAVTKVMDTLTREDFHGGIPEVVGTVQPVHCSRRRLLWRGLEFHVCTINKSAYTKKTSGNLSYAPRIYIYIYILVLVLVWYLLLPNKKVTEVEITKTTVGNEMGIFIISIKRILASGVKKVTAASGDYLVGIFTTPLHNFVQST